MGYIQLYVCLLDLLWVCGLLDDLLQLQLWWLLEWEAAADVGAWMAGIQLGSAPCKPLSSALSGDSTGALGCMMLYCP